MTAAVMAPGSFWNAPLPANMGYEGFTTQARTVIVAAAAKATNVNTTTFSVQPHTVPATQPLVPVELKDPKWGGVTPSWALPRVTICAAGLPIPAGYVPQGDRDDSACFYMPDWVSDDGALHGAEWDCWRLRPQDPATGFSFGCEGFGRLLGVAESPGHYVARNNAVAKDSRTGLPRDTAKAELYEEKTWGSTATALPLLPGVITQADIDRGAIDHALGVAIPTRKTAFRWPAARSDGALDSSPLLEGMRLFLPYGYKIPTGLHPLARMIAVAVQKYGMVIWDKAGDGIAFRAVPSARAFFGTTPGYRILTGFPWSVLRVAKTGSDATPNPLSTW